MANGIVKRNLVRDIAERGEWVDSYDLSRAVEELDLLPRATMVDSQYWVVPPEVQADIIRHVGAHEFPYRKDRSDCDDFARYPRSRAALELGVNCFAVVEDISAGHAYIMAVSAADAPGADYAWERLRFTFYEPQTGAVVLPGQSEMYAAREGTIRL